MNNRAIVFARRNMTEILRSPVSWVFGLILPIGIFVIMQVILGSIGEDAAHVPMFGVDRFTGGVVIFGASFLSLFCALLVSGDKSQSFLARLFASPMRPSDYIVGYMLSVFPVVIAQILITYTTALCFGLKFTVNVLPAALFSVLIALMFAAIGIILGSLLSAKNAPPLCSIVVQIAVLLCGMWFDLDGIGGGFNVFCHVLPFANAYDLIRYTLSGEYGNVWLPFIAVVAYAVVFVAGAAAAFGRAVK